MTTIGIRERWLIAIIAIGLSGCQPGLHYRDYHKSDVGSRSAGASNVRELNRNILYNTLESGHLNGPSDMGAVGIELPDGRRLHIRDLTESMLREFVSPEANDDSCFTIGHISITFHDERAIRFFASYSYQDKSHPPVLLDRSLTKRYIFPISQPELIELAGEGGQFADHQMPGL